MMNWIMLAAISGGACWLTQVAAADEKLFSPDRSGPMVFHQAYNGGNCTTCEWIAAQGLFIEGTAALFEKFLKEEYSTPAGTRSATVVFDSDGGNLLEAIRVGELIRQWNLETSVGATSGVLRDWGGLYSEEMREGICASACAYSTLGGVRRSLAGSGKIGVHQHYSEKSLRAPLEETASAIDRSVDQLLTGLTLEYVIRMGVDPRLVTIAASVPPWGEIHWLTDAELADLGADNTSDRYSDPKLIPFGAKGAAIEVLHSQGLWSNPSNPTQYRLYCRGAKKVPHFAVISHASTSLAAAVKEALGPNLDFEVQDKDGIKTVLQPKLIDVSEKVEADGSFTVASAWSLPDASVDTIVSIVELKAVERAGGSLPNVYRSIFEEMAFRIPASDRLLGLAFRACVS